MTRAEVLCLIW